MENIISIDPGGKTGIYYRNGEQEQFIEINQSWKETYREIKELVKNKQIQQVIYEDTNYIHKKTRDGLNLFRLLGALECLEVKDIKSINVLRVKGLYKKLVSNKETISNLTYSKGRGHGWKYKNKRISIHCLDALLIFYLHSK